MSQQHIDMRLTIVGGVDTHKDLHVAAVVDERDRILSSASFPTTRHGYKSMLGWMRSFGTVDRIGVECTGTYGTGLLRYLQHATSLPWKSPRLIKPRGESGVKTIRSMRRMRPMPPSPGFELSRPRPVMA